MIIGTIYQHDGKEAFPHGAGECDPGFYCYAAKPGEDLFSEDNHPDGPFEHWDDAVDHLGAMFKRLAEEEKGA